MKDILRRPLLAMLAAVPPMRTAVSADASFPTRRIEFVVPFPPGGTTDMVARLIAEQLRATWSQPVVIDNRAGATGAIGAEYVSRAAPDGYTLLVGTASVNSVLPSAKPDTRFDTLRDFRPVAMLATFPNLLVVHPALPARTVAELIQIVRARPDHYAFGSSGIGGTVHLSGELFQSLSGTSMIHVPYRGSAPAVADLLAGRVQIMFDNMATVWPYVQQGQLRALAVTSATRSPLFPDLPAISETLPGYEASSWVGLLAPRRVPDDIVATLAAAVDRARRDPTVVARMAEAGAIPGTGNPEEFATFLASDVARWGALVRRLNVRMD